MQDDNYYHVEYKCSVCGKVTAIDDTNLARIASEFKRLGWENEPVQVSSEKTEYVVTCSDCIEKQLRDEDAYHDACAVWDTERDFETGTGRW